MVGWLLPEGHVLEDREKREAISLPVSTWLRPSTMWTQAPREQCPQGVVDGLPAPAFWTTANVQKADLEHVILVGNGGEQKRKGCVREP